MPNFQIRTATGDDDDTWLRLRAELWPECSGERLELECQLYHRSPGIVALALDENNEAFGFAEVSLRHEHVTGSRGNIVPYLEGWYVSSDWQGQGVGRALIEFVEKWARSAGFSEIASDAEMDNTGSQEAHKRLGFREVDRTVSFIKDLHD